MGFSALQIILVFVWVFIVAIDQFDFLESLYQPIVSGAVIGAILGDLPTGLIVGGTYQLMTIGNMHMAEGKRQVAGSVAVDDADVAAFKRLQELGVELEIRRVPTEHAENIEKLFK